MIFISSLPYKDSYSHDKKNNQSNNKPLSLLFLERKKKKFRFSSRSNQAHLDAGGGLGQQGNSCSSHFLVFLDGIY